MGTESGKEDRDGEEGREETGVQGVEREKDGEIRRGRETGKDGKEMYI